MSATIATVGKRGQVTLPQAIRMKMDIHPGDQVAFILMGRQVLLHPLTETLLSLRGSVPVDGPQDFPAIRRKASAGRGQKRGRDGS